MLLWVIALPLQYVAVLTFNTAGWNVIREQGLYTGDQVEVRLLGWVLTQYNWCPYKKGKCKHTCTEG